MSKMSSSEEDDLPIVNLKGSCVLKPFIDGVGTILDEDRQIRDSRSTSSASKKVDHDISNLTVNYLSTLRISRLQTVGPLLCLVRR